MYCNICKRFFLVKRSFKELLKNKKVLLCDECSNKIIINLEILIFPIGKYNIDIITLYENINQKYLNYDIDYYSKIFDLLYKKNIYFHIIDEFNYDKLDILEYILTIENKKVVFISFLLKTLL